MISFYRIVKFLGTCQAETGGFGGGPGQISHLATTYAAVNALCTLNTANAYSIIKVKPMLKWMQGLKMSNGAFRMHDDGEEDLRFERFFHGLTKYTGLS